MYIFTLMMEALLLFRLHVYPLHSTVTLEEQNSVFRPPVPGYRKVKNSLIQTLTFCLILLY